MAGLPDSTEVRTAEPLQCWSRTSASAVHVGERFSLVLTCAVIDTPSLTVVLDETKLDPSATQFPPFEVLGGRHVPDLRNGDRRFFQYVYDLRLIDDALFGKVATLPAITLTYRVQTGADQGASNEGVERAYLTPSQPIRVLSLVSDDTADIRDAERATFDELAAGALHANGVVAIGGVLMGLAVLLTVVAVARVSTQARATGPAGERPVHNRSVLRGIGRELEAVRREREQTGWTAALVGRTLASQRIASRALLSEPLMHRAEDPDVPSAEGSLSLSGARGRKPIVVWGSITPDGIARALAEKPKGRTQLPVARRQQLQQLREHLACLTRVHYGRDAQLPDPALDDALASAQELVASLRREEAWFVRIFGTATQPVRARRRP
jgi:hypothetical protein